MAGRYEAWRRLRGDTDRPDLITYGNKLLGYLQEQRRLGKAQSQSIIRTLRDGSVVRAQFVGDQPIVEILTQPAPEATTLPEAAAGFVIKPRNVGTAAPLDGGDVFGDFPEVLLNRISKDSPWVAQYYDSANTPTGAAGSSTYRRNRRGDEIWPDGLKFAGNMDWRNKDETLALTFMGEATRSLGFDSYWKTVFYGGEEILTYPDYVESACLRVEGEKLYLVFIGNVYQPTLYRVELQPHADLNWWAASGVHMKHCPRVATVDLADIETIKVLPLPLFMEERWTNFSFLYAGRFVFNQDGTEARKICVHYDTEGEYIKSLEIVVSCDTLDADHVTASETHIDALQITRTETVTYTDVRLNRIDRMVADIDYSAVGDTGPCTVAIGDYGASISYHHESNGLGWQTTNPDNNPIVYVGDCVRTTNDVQTGSDNLRIAVDYQDNQPVYLRWKPALYHGQAQRISAGSHSYMLSDFSATRHYRFDGCSGGLGSLVGEHFVSTTQDTAQSTMSGASNFSHSEGRLWAEDPSGAAWLDLRVTGAGSGTYGGSSSAQSHEDLDEDIWTGTFAGSTARLRTETRSLSSTYASSYSGAGGFAHLWFLDLRYRSAAYSLLTRTVSSTFEETMDGAESLQSTDGGTTYTVTSGGTSRADIDRNFSNTTVVDDVTSYDTRVVFYGREVNQFLGTYADTSIPNSSSSGTTNVGWDRASQTAWVMRGTAGGYVSRLPEDPTAGALPLVNGGFTDGTLVGDLVHETEILDFYNSNDPPPMDTGGFDFDAPATSLTADTYTYPAVADQAAPVIADIQATYAMFSGPINWAWGALDREGVPFYWNQHELNGGTWLAHRGQWVYSMAAPQGDVTVHRWNYEIRGGNLAKVTGDRDPPPEVFYNAWPMGLVIVQK